MLTASYINITRKFSNSKIQIIQLHSFASEKVPNNFFFNSWQNRVAKQTELFSSRYNSLERL